MARVISEHEIAHAPLGATLKVTTFPKARDKFPVIDSADAELAIRNAVLLDERFDVVQDWVSVHAPCYMRGISRTASEKAGSLPALLGSHHLRHKFAVESAPPINLAKLKSALVEHTGTGKKFTRRGLSMLASEGRNPDIVRDILRGNSASPELATVASLANVLDIDVGEFLTLRMPIPERKYLLRVEGEVSAGVWREQTDWSEDQSYMIEVGPPPFPKAERFALKMIGRSMEKTIPSGSELECLRVPFGLVEPKPGQLVIVQRTRHDLHELTCKRLVREGTQWLLRCESHAPEFQSDIPIGSPDGDLHTDAEVSIVGIVLSAQQRHFSLG